MYVTSVTSVTRITTIFWKCMLQVFSESLCYYYFLEMYVMSASLKGASQPE